MNGWLDANADGLALMIIFGVIAIVCLVLAMILEPRHMRRYHQRDWVAERHRKVTHRAFKSRAGIRS